MFEQYSRNLIFSMKRISRVQSIGLHFFWLSFPFIVIFLLMIFTPYFGSSLFSSSNIKHSSDLLAHAAAIFMVCCLALAFVNIFLVRIRRLNDCDLRGWWSLFVLFPEFRGIWGIIIFCLPGTKGENRFGKQPSKNRLSDYLRIVIFPAIFIALFIMFIIQTPIKNKPNHISGQKVQQLKTF